MGYQQFAHTPPQTSQHVIHRKPPANYSPIPKTPTDTYRSGMGAQTSIRTPSLSHSAALVPSSPYGPPTPSSTTSASRLPEPFPTGTLSQSEVDAALKSCLAVLTEAVTTHGKRPSSAILLAPDNTTIILTHNCISLVQHAESELARLASSQYSAAYLAKCTLVSAWEPCAMCAGTIYWTGIGRLLYAASETTLRQLADLVNEDDNMTMGLPCRTVLTAGSRQVEVIGPISTWEDRVVEASKKWWEAQQLSSSTKSSSAAPQEDSNRNSVVVVPEDSLLSSIGEDGEYQADLKVDWMM